MSKLTYSHSTRARLGPLQEGLHNFASNASYDTFRYNSHVGNTPSYNTILNCLYLLAEQSAAKLLEICNDPGFWFWLTLDNVQNYNRPRTHGLGRENKMNIGIAATLWVAPKGGPDPSIFLDYDKKQALRSACKRDQITTTKLLSELDGKHEKLVFSIHWLWVLGHHLPDLEELATAAMKRLRQDARRQQQPDEPTQCFPLPTVGGSETQLPELKGGIVNFLESSGQTVKKYHKRMCPIGGDGLTYELMLKIKSQLQLHASPFLSFRFVDPTFALWHAEWTNDGRIIRKSPPNLG